MVKTYAVNCNDAWLQTPGDDLNGSYVKYEDYAELERRLLAAEAREPAAWRAIYHGEVVDEFTGKTLAAVQDYADRFGWESSLTEIIPPRSAPQPVAVPDDDKTNMLCDSAYVNGLQAGFSMGQMNQEAEYAQTVEHYRKGIREYRAAMLNAEPVSQPYTLPQWIPCSERMPEDKPGHSEYLVYETLNNRVQHDYWVVTGEWDFRQFWNHYGNYVTHWMPLPAAPQEPTK